MGSQRAPRHPGQIQTDGYRSARVAGAGRAVNASPVPVLHQAFDDALSNLAGTTTQKSFIDLFTLTSTGPQSLTLTNLPLDASWNVSLNGITAKNGVDYSISDVTLSLLTPVDARTGDVLQVQYDFLTGLPAS